MPSRAAPCSPPCRFPSPPTRSLHESDSDAVAPAAGRLAPAGGGAAGRHARRLRRQGQRTGRAAAAERGRGARAAEADQ
ncbi:hypothetical protein CEK64_18765, partial [Xanthomonas sontii]